MFRRLREFLFNTENRVIFSMFVPIVIEQLVITMIGTVHTVMLSNVGKEAISAVGLVDQLNQFAFAVFTSISVGATVVVSQYIGMGKPIASKCTAEQAVIIGTALSVVVGAVFVVFKSEVFGLFFGETEQAVKDFALIYLVASAASFPMISLTTTASGVIRGVGDARSPMLISTLMGITNAAIAAVCIFGLDLGVVGASIALVSSRTIGAAVAVTIMLKKRLVRSFKNLFMIRPLYIKQILRIGLYAGTENIIFQGGKVLVQGFVVSAGTIHIAANSIAGSAFSLCAVPGNSMSIIATTLVGRYTGAGDKEGAYKSLHNILLLSSGMLGLLNIALLPFTRQIISMYTPEKEIADIVHTLFIMNIVCMPLFWSAAFVFFSGMKGAGDARYTTIISVVSMWCCRVLVGFILGKQLGMGVVGVWMGMFTDWIVRGIFALARFRSRKWQGKTVI